MTGGEPPGSTPKRVQVSRADPPTRAGQQPHERIAAGRGNAEAPGRRMRVRPWLRFPSAGLPGTHDGRAPFRLHGVHPGRYVVDPAEAGGFLERLPRPDQARAPAGRVDDGVRRRRRRLRRRLRPRRRHPVLMPALRRRLETLVRTPPAAEVTTRAAESDPRAVGMTAVPFRRAWVTPRSSRSRGARPATPVFGRLSLCRGRAILRRLRASRKRAPSHLVARLWRPHLPHVHGSHTQPEPHQRRAG